MHTLDARPALAERAAGARAPLATRLLEPAPLSPLELALCALALGALAALTFLPHILHGGFYADDWGVLEIARYPEPHSGGLWHTLMHYYGRRPGQVLWIAALDLGIGYHASLQLAVAGALLVGESLCLYALLRRLGMAVLHAGAVAALVLIFPFSDSLWLWSVVSIATLSSTIYLLGVLLALSALRARGVRAVALHGASLALYLVALFSYEWFALLGCLAGALYVFQAGWKRAWWRWALDVAVIAGSVAVSKLVLSDRVTPYRTQSLHGTTDHAGHIASTGARLIGAAAEPFGSPDRLAVLAAVGVVLALSLAVRLALPHGDPARAQLGRWLAVALAGLAVIVAAWAIFAPAIDAYSPASPGTGNRVNGLAGIGIVLLLFAAAMLLGTLLARVAYGTRVANGTSVAGTTRPALASALALALSVVLAVGYLQRDGSDSRRWDRSAATQAALVAEIHRLAPHPRRGAVLYVFGAPAIDRAAPAFEYPWELSSAVRASYNDALLTAARINPGTSWGCDSNHLWAHTGLYAGLTEARYGLARFLDVRAGRAATVSGRARCHALLTLFAPAQRRTS